MVFLLKRNLIYMVKGLFCSLKRKGVHFGLHHFVHPSTSDRGEASGEGASGDLVSPSIQNETRGNFLSAIVCAPGVAVVTTAAVIGDRRTALQCHEFEIVMKFLVR